MKKFIFGTLLKTIEITILIVIVELLQGVMVHTCCGMDSNIKIALNAIHWMNICLIIEVILDAFVWSVIRSFKLNNKKGESK